LIVLLCIMFVLGGALLVDLYVFKPQCDAAGEALGEAVAAQGAKSIDVTGRDKAFLAKEEVQQVLKRQPTVSKVVDGHLKEYYCWWGPLRLPRRYITAIYEDADGKRLRAYYVENDEEPATAPITPRPIPADGNSGGATPTGPKSSESSGEEPAENKPADEKPSTTEGDTPAVDSAEKPESP
jgi:hypothetical protein